MTLPQNVKDADEEMVAAGGEIIWRHYPAIRAHLLIQEAEIERLQSGLAAANAMLQRTQMKDYDAAAWLRLGVEIQAHLSENTHDRA